MAIRQTRDEFVRKLILKDEKFRRIFLNLLVKELFVLIHKSYQKKAKGETDEFGESWKPNTLSTKQYSGRGTKIPGKRGLLNREQNKNWKRIFAQVFNRLASTIGPLAAKERAAQIAWNVVKEDGAKLVKDRAKVSDKRIGIDSQELFDSFEPGEVTGDNYISVPNQSVRIDDTSIEIGTLVPYSIHFNRIRKIIPNAESLVQKAVFETLKKLKRQLENL